MKILCGIVASVVMLCAFNLSAQSSQVEIRPAALDIRPEGKISAAHRGFELGADGTYTIAATFAPLFPRSGGTRGIVFSFGNGWSDGLRMCIEPHRDGYAVGIEIAQERKDKSDGQVLLLQDSKTSFVKGWTVCFAASWDGKNVRLYVNGREKLSCGHNKSFVPPKSKLVMFGKGGYGLPYHPVLPFRGRIWKQALDSSQIAAIAAEDLKAFPKSVSYGSVEDLSRLLAMCDSGDDALRAEIEERLAFAFLSSGNEAKAKEYFAKTLPRKKNSPYDASFEFRGQWVEALEKAGLHAQADAALKEMQAEAPIMLKTPYISKEVRFAKHKNFFVAPNGDDCADGSEAKPFASVARAQQAIRDLKKSGQYPKSGVCVYLRGGRYPMHKRILFEECDSGNPGAPVVWRAYKDEKPVFHGGWPLPQLKIVEDAAAIARIPVSARKYVRCCDVRSAGYRHLQPPAPYGAGCGAIKQPITDLYVDGVWQQPARYPNDGFLNAKGSGEGCFVTDAEPIAGFAKEQEMLATGFWKHLWLDATVRVKCRTENGNGIVEVVEPSGFDMAQAAGKPYFLCNALCALDQPGEWYLDSVSGMLYVWPQEGAKEIMLSDFSDVFLNARALHDVVFEGLAFECGRLDAVDMRNCRNVKFLNNTVRNFARHGISAIDAKNVIIEGNKVLGFGGRGVYVSGGERKTLTPAENVIKGNEIAFVERRMRTYAPGLQLDGCGMDVEQNHFHDMPSSAVRIEGNDYWIVSNRFERVVTESDDQGGIDIYRDPSYAGVFIAHNIFTDVGTPQERATFASCGQAAVRFDGNISGMTVYSNMFERCGRAGFGAVQVNGGRNNRIEGNTFVDCWCAVSISYYAPKKWLNEMNNVRELFEKKVNIHLSPFSEKYPGIATLDTQTNQTNYVVRNVMVRTDRLLSTRSPDALVYGNVTLGTSFDDEAFAR